MAKYFKNKLAIWSHCYLCGFAQKNFYLRGGWLAESSERPPHRYFVLDSTHKFVHIKRRCCARDLNPGHRMAGADCSTDLWRPPATILFRVKLLIRNVQAFSHLNRQSMSKGSRIMVTSVTRLGEFLQVHGNKLSDKSSPNISFGDFWVFLIGNVTFM